MVNNRPTELGIELRKLRIENHMNMAEMASRLDMSTSQLSAIETGQRPVPSDFIQKFLEKFPEWAHLEMKLEELATLQRGTVTFRVEEPRKAKAMAAFARSLNSDVSDQFIAELEVFLKKRGQ
jgi:HTH-type transcriptional regulator, competence development regulator